MNDYDDDSGPDENDKLFNEIDDMVEFAKESLKREADSNRKFDVRLDLINLMMEEVNPEDIRIHQQMGNSWIAEVKYRGINFICVVGKHKPQFWDEIFEE